jgi:hypothetical protein
MSGFTILTERSGTTVLNGVVVPPDDLPDIKLVKIWDKVNKLVINQVDGNKIIEYLVNEYKFSVLRTMPISIMGKR